MIPLLRRRVSATASIPAGGLADVIAAMSPSWRDDFSSTANFGDRWSIFGETSGSTALGPVIAWGDHYGTHTHDPALVSIADGALKLKWEKRAGVWYTGGVTTAAAYGYSPSNPAPKAVTPNNSVIVARIKTPITQGNIWGGFWQLARNNQADGWGVRPREIDILEFTYPSPPDGNKDIAYSAVHYKPASGNHAAIGVNSSALNNSIYDGDWHEYACHRRTVDGLVKMDFYLDGVFYGTITPPESNSDFADGYLAIINCQSGFWGAGVPADDASGKAIEVDWIAEYVTPTVPPSTRPTDAPVLQAKGLSLVWQSREGESDEPADSTNWFSPHMGSRNTSADLGLTDNRLSFVTFDGKRCLREIYRANQAIVLNYRSQRLPARYREFGSCADVFYPQSFNPIPQDTGRTSNSGKTVFGLLLGHPDFMRPGFRTDYGWAGSVCWPEDMWGGECGVNWTSRNASGNVEYDWYPHIVGAYVDGADKMRSTANTPSYLQPYDGAYSHPVAGQVVPPKQAIPKGRWFRLELYGRVDTNRRDGVLEMWIDGTLFAAWTGLDLGGWVGDRGLYKGRSQTPAPAGMAFTYTNTPYYSFGIGPLSNDCDPAFRTLGGFRFIGAFIRAMGGGYSLSTAHIPVSEHKAYFHNWRFYAKA